MKPLLEMILESIKNMAAGRVSTPVNFDEFREQIDSNNDDDDLDFSDFYQLSDDLLPLKKQ